MAIERTNKVGTHRLRDAAVTNAKIADATIAAGKLAANTISFRVPVAIPDSAQTGLAADSTGTKWTSAFKLKWNKTHLKAVRIRATWTASHTDSTTKIAIQDDSNSTDIASVSGNAGTDTEDEATDLSNVTDDGLATVYAEVTAASAATGATFDITYVVVELVFGVS